MFPVKGSLEGGLQRGRMHVVRKHGGPGDRLEDRPMGTGRAHQGNDQQEVAKAGKHSQTIPQDRMVVKKSALYPAPGGG